MFIQALSLAAWSTLEGVYLMAGSGVVTPTLPPLTAPAAPPTEPGDPPHAPAVMADTGPAPMSGLIEAPYPFWSLQSILELKCKVCVKKFL